MATKPSQKVFFTPELLEQILLQPTFTMKDLTLGRKLHTFAKNLIDSAPKLKQKLFLQAAPVTESLCWVPGPPDWRADFGMPPQRIPVICRGGLHCGEEHKGDIAGFTDNPNIITTLHPLLQAHTLDSHNHLSTGIRRHFHSSTIAQVSNTTQWGEAFISQPPVETVWLEMSSLSRWGSQLEDKKIFVNGGVKLKDLFSALRDCGFGRDREAVRMVVGGFVESGSRYVEETKGRKSSEAAKKDV